MAVHLSHTRANSFRPFWDRCDQRRMIGLLSCSRQLCDLADLHEDRPRRKIARTAFNGAARAECDSRIAFVYYEND